MPKIATLNQPGLLQATLEGLTLQKRRIDEQIQMIQGMLGRKSKASAGVSGASSPTVANGRRRNLSPEARKRIAEAQQKRWAAYRKQRGK